MLDLVLRLLDRLIELAKRKEEVNRAAFSNFVQPLFQAFEAVHGDYVDSLVGYRRRFDDLSLKMDIDHPVFEDIHLQSLKSEHLRIKLRGFHLETSPEKLRPMLVEIDDYLNGLIGSIDGLSLVQKLAFTPKDITQKSLKKSRLAELGSWTTVTLSSEKEENKAASPGQRTPFDPVRQNLADYLFLFDYPGGSSENATLESWHADFSDFRILHLTELSDMERRVECKRAIDLTITSFQSAYANISDLYSKLRSELLVSK